MDKIILWIIIVVLLLLAFKKADKVVKAMDVEDKRQPSMYENEGTEEQNEVQINQYKEIE